MIAQTSPLSDRYADRAMAWTPFIDDAPSNRHELLAWLDSIRRDRLFRVERVPLEEIDGWQFGRQPLRIHHHSGKFFSIEGVRIETDFGQVQRWDQPIINQPEIGILGIMTQVIGGTRRFLMQAKAEPGNVNSVQLSPTLQATRSNFTRVHGGRTPQYLEYFTGQEKARFVVDQLQSEQGSRFLGKRNRNMIIEPAGEVEDGGDFRWMTLAEIKDLLQLDNVVNMDARSVLSCIPLMAQRDEPRTAFGDSLLDSAARRTDGDQQLNEIVNWFSCMRATYQRTIVTRGLDRLEDWEVTDTEVRHEQGKYFSVVGTSIELADREVVKWSQPLLHHSGPGLNGMVTQRIGGVLHFLIRACLYPGNRDLFELGSTVSRSDYVNQFGAADAPPFLELFENPDPSTVRFSSVQSEEGGRFLHYQNQYMILELPPNTVDELPEGFLWMTLGQIEELLPHGYFNIEARNLLSLLWVGGSGQPAKSASSPLKKL